MLSSNYLNLGSSHAPSGTLLVILVIIVIVAYLIGAFINSFIFQKANRKKSSAYIPVYNVWVLFEIAGLPGWLVFIYLLSIIPIIGYFISLGMTVVLSINLAKKFNKSMVFAIFGLVIFDIIGYLMLAFGKSQYNETNSQSNNLSDDQSSQSSSPQSPTDNSSLSATSLTPNQVVVPPLNPVESVQPENNSIPYSPVIDQPSTNNPAKITANNLPENQTISIPTPINTETVAPNPMPVVEQPFNLNVANNQEAPLNVAPETAMTNTPTPPIAPDNNQQPNYQQPTVIIPDSQSSNQPNNPQNNNQI